MCDIYTNLDDAIRACEEMEREHQADDGTDEDCWRDVVEAIALHSTPEVAADLRCTQL